MNLLHEFELSILKSILRYLLQIIHAVDPHRIDTLNEQSGLIPSSEYVTNRHFDRFTQVSPFGLRTICCFPPDVADMGQQPGWFFEQVLQVLSFFWVIPGWLAALMSFYYSVPSLFLKGSSLLPTIHPFNIFFFDYPNGMHWRSSESTLTIPLHFSSSPYDV